MATKRLSEGWTLSCGIWPPFLMPAPKDVESALREQGILKLEPAGLDALYDQWVYGQGWVYALEFDCPGEDERAFLRFEALSGRGAVRLNGRPLARFESGELSVDITGAVEGEGNRLEVSFDPTLPDGAPRGVLGPVWLRTTNFLTLRRVRASEADGVLRVRSEMTAHAAGRYLFRYTASLDDQAVLESGVYERLRASDQAVEHALKIPSPARWDGERYYTVRLEVERSGVGCDMVRVNAAMGAGKPSRVALIPAHRLRDRDLLRALRDLGAEAAASPSAHRENALLPFDLLPDGLLLADEAQRPEDGDLLALPEVRALEKLAGGERFWPPGCPVWWAAGSPCPDEKAAEALYGANALGDAARYARISRFVQAEAVRARALASRRDGAALAVEAAEAAPAYASGALIEHSGRKRPAYAALRQAWEKTCAAFLTPEPLEARAPLEVWLFSDEPVGRPLSVTASVYALDGQLIASTSFAALSGATARLGALSAHLPEEGIVVARAELQDDGGAVRRVDQVICLGKPGAPARSALLNPPRAVLRAEGGALQNAGPAAALGVLAGAFYGALLPGEKIALTEGFAARDIESLNGQGIS